MDRVDLTDENFAVYDLKRKFSKLLHKGTLKASENRSANTYTLFMQMGYSRNHFVGVVDPLS